MAPNEGIEIKATGTVHLSLQGKGGVGKSLVASILAQYLDHQALAVRCIDSDPVNKTLSQYKGLRTAPLPLLREGDIDQRAFDGLMEDLLTNDGVFVVDNGASTFIPLWNYILENNVPELLRAAGKRLFVHTVITGGQALADTLNGFGQLAESTSDQNIVVWVNEYFGRVERDGKQFLNMKVFEDNAQKVCGTVAIIKRNHDTFGRDIEDMVSQKLTFDEAIRDGHFTIMTKQRLPTTVAPATQAGTEFVSAVPLGNAPLAKAAELHPKGNVDAACGTDPRTGSPYRYNPQTGQPCEGIQQERVVIRQSPRQGPPKQLEQPREPTAEEQAAALAYRREHEAVLAPTGTSGSRPLESPQSSVRAPNSGAPPLPDVSQILARSQVVRPPAAPSDDYTVQNMQARKEAFMITAAGRQTDDYLRSIRSAPLSRFEIKAGWEFPAILEQSLNSDPPGELKALVTSNVYDTATGMYLLIPQGSRLIGQYDSRVSYGQEGVQVTWSRVIFPDTSAIDLNGMVGLDSHGNAGLCDKVDRHYRRLLGFSVLTSFLTAAFAVSQQRNQSILMNPNPAQVAAGAIGQDLSRTGAQITRRNLNVQPTIKIPAGYQFTVRVNRDILFEAPYESPAAAPARE